MGRVGQLVIRRRGQFVGFNKSSISANCTKLQKQNNKPNGEVVTPRLKSPPTTMAPTTMAPTTMAPTDDVGGDKFRYDERNPNLNLHELMGGLDYYILSFVVEVAERDDIIDQTDLSPQHCSHGGSPATCEQCSKFAKKLWCARERALSLDGRATRQAQRDNCVIRSVCKRWDSWFGGDKRMEKLYSRVSLRLPNPSSQPLLENMLASFGKWITTIDISNQSSQTFNDSTLRGLIGRCEGLISLSLRRCGVSGKGFGRFEKGEGVRPKLKFLALNDCKMLNDKGVGGVCKGFGDSLVTVSISGNKLLTDKSVRYERRAK